MGPAASLEAHPSAHDGGAWDGGQLNCLAWTGALRIKLRCECDEGGSYSPPSAGFSTFVVDPVPFPPTLSLHPHRVSWRTPQSADPPTPAARSRCGPAVVAMCPRWAPHALTPLPNPPQLVPEVVPKPLGGGGDANGNGCQGPVRSVDCPTRPWKEGAWEPGYALGVEKELPPPHPPPWPDEPLLGFCKAPVACSKERAVGAI